MRNKAPLFLSLKFGLSTIKTYLCMKDEIESLIKEYYRVLKITPNKSRKAEQVKARAAMMVALRKYSTTMLIADVFGVDHSTVVHHSKKHRDNVRFWTGYKSCFITAERMCSVTMKYKTTQAKLKSVRTQISRLRRMENELQETLKLKS
jgi:hypothetical protein